MKKIALAATLAFAAATATAGTLEEPIVEPVIIEEDTGGTGAGWVVPALLVLLIAGIAAN
ncbi:MAG: hypothetical protein ACPGNV_10100 [Mangrovicoccus sp.]